MKQARIWLISTTISSMGPTRGQNVFLMPKMLNCTAKVSRESDLRSMSYNRHVGVRSFVKKVKIT